MRSRRQRSPESTTTPGAGRGRTAARAVAAAVLAVVVVLVTGPAAAHAQTAPTESTNEPSPSSGDGNGSDPSPSPTTGPDGTTDEEPGPSATPTDTTEQEPADPTEDRSAPDATPTEEPTPEPATSPRVRPSVRRSGIPVGTILLAVGVLAAVGLAANLTVRRAGSRSAAGTSASTSAETTPVPRPPARVPADDRELIAFLLELGEALVDAGDAVDRIGSTLRTIAEREGLRDVGMVVLPTALIISVPGRERLQTDVTAAGGAPLRLDQVAAVLRVVDEARDGRVHPTEGRARLARIRASRSPVSGGPALAGHALTAVGLALILRGGALEVGLAAALGVATGALQLVASPRRSSFRPFLPVVAAFLVATSVLLVARVAPGLAILPPLVAPLIPFLPGGLLTVGTLELATGQAVSGVARLGSGGLQLVLLAGGVLGAAQFVGVPAPADVVMETAAPGIGGIVGVVAPWAGVALFGIGLTGSRAAPRSLLPWILLILYVAYAGQIIGGFFFGNTLSAFFGAFAMTPVAVYASRQRLGPPALVAFLPGFWLLVPGALGLEGVTRILSEQGVQGVAALATTGGAMVGIALGILLGLLVAAPDTWRLRGPAGSGAGERT